MRKRTLAEIKRRADAAGSVFFDRSHTRYSTVIYIAPTPPEDRLARELGEDRVFFVTYDSDHVNRYGVWLQRADGRVDWVDRVAGREAAILIANKLAAGSSSPSSNPGRDNDFRSQLVEADRHNQWRWFKKLPRGEYIVSVQASEPHYSQPRGTLDDPFAYSEWEVAVFRSPGRLETALGEGNELATTEEIPKYMQDYQETRGTYAYAPTEIVQRLLDDLAGKASNNPILRGKRPGELTRGPVPPEPPFKLEASQTVVREKSGTWAILDRLGNVLARTLPWPRHDAWIQAERVDRNPIAGQIVREGDRTRTIVTEQKGTWRWQNAFRIVTYEARYGPGGALRWYATTKSRKMSIPQIKRAGLSYLPRGSRHRQLIYPPTSGLKRHSGAGRGPSGGLLRGEKARLVKALGESEYDPQSEAGDPGPGWLES